MSNTKLIFKNTIFLYCRQFVVLFIALFTTRIVINTLGVEDYGLYNLIAGVITLLTILTASMTSATQRFLAMSLGNNGKSEFYSIYSVCTTLFIILSIIIFVIGETFGLWFINNMLIIPPNRIVAANLCYQTALLSFILRILRVSSNATIIAFEKMDFYAYVSIFEVIIQLLIAYSLYLTSYDHLIVYSALNLFSTLFNNAIYTTYCIKKLGIRFNGLSLEKKYFNSIFSFSFWTFLGSLSNIGTRQAINILINRFFGIRLNAATGIATKVGGNAYDFVANFTTAYRPQILKLYAAGKLQELYQLAYRATKLSCFLFIIIMIPLNLNLDLILQLWLGVVPEHTADFCRLLMIFLSIDAYQAPLVVMVHAIGNIRNFQIIFSIINILNIPVMWFLLQSHMPPESIYFCYILFNVLTSAYRTVYVKTKSTLDFKTYICLSLRLLITSVLAYTIGYYLVGIIPSDKSWLYLIFISLLLVLTTLTIIISIGINVEEKQFLYIQIKNKIKR